MLILYASLSASRNAVWRDDVALWEASLEQNPDNYVVYANLGVAYAGEGQYEKAIEFLKKSTAIWGDNIMGYYNLAIVFGTLKRYHEEIQALEQVIRIDPAFAEAHYNLGIIYARLGDKSSALGEYEILKTLDRNMAERLGGVLKNEKIL